MCGTRAPMVEAPDGWVVTKGMKGAAITVEEVGKAEPVVANFEAFARAVRGEAALSRHPARR